jgi:hypothetical protein
LDVGDRGSGRRRRKCEARARASLLIARVARAGVRTDHAGAPRPCSEAFMASLGGGSAGREARAGVRLSGRRARTMRGTGLGRRRTGQAHEESWPVLVPAWALTLTLGIGAGVGSRCGAPGVAAGPRGNAACVCGYEERSHEGWTGGVLLVAGALSLMPLLPWWVDGSRAARGGLARAPGKGAGQGYAGEPRGPALGGGGGGGDGPRAPP